MSLSKPILLPQAAFDATQDHVFEFNAVGGDQVVKNKLTIVNQLTGVIIYSQEQVSYSFSHRVEADTLENGEYYSAYVQTYNALGEESSPSAYIQFYCFTTPEFYFSNFPIDEIITNSSFEFVLHYSQAEDEELESFNFSLYNAQGVKIATSGVKYASSVPTLSHAFIGLLDNTTYFIEAEGKTVYGTLLSTSRNRFNVAYYRPNVFSAVELKNNCSEGYITIQSNLVAIEGEAIYPPVYQEDKYVVLQDNTVTWNSGFSFGADGFTASLWSKYAPWTINKQLIGFSNADGSVVKVGLYRDYDDNSKVYADLRVKVGVNEYYVCSESIPIPNSEDNVQIWFRKKNGYYSIKLVNLSN